MSAITALATVFGIVTLAAPVAVAWRFRHKPVAALIAAQERRVAFHRDTLAALETAIAAARASGRPAEAERLTPHLAEHRRKLDELAAMAPFAGRR